MTGQENGPQISQITQIGKHHNKKRDGNSVPPLFFLLRNLRIILLPITAPRSVSGIQAQ